MKRILFAAALISAQAFAEDPRINALILQADTAEKQQQPRAALGALHAAERLDPNDIRVLLRMSRQYSNLVDATPARQTAKENAEKSLAYAKRAVAVDPKNAKAHLSVSVGYGKLTDFAGNKQKLEYSKIIRDAALRSIELDATDDFAWHVLGRWHFGVANVNPVLKAMARLIYGGVPEASNEEAVRCLKKACELAPFRLIHHSELARVYATLGKKDAARVEWKTVLALPAVDAEDVKDKREARLAISTQ